MLDRNDLITCWKHARATGQAGKNFLSKTRVLDIGAGGAGIDGLFILADWRAGQESPTDAGSDRTGHEF